MSQTLEQNLNYRPIPHRTRALAPIRVLMVDDHLLIRKGIEALFQGIEGFELVGQAEDGRQAVSMFRSLHPDVTLMDLQLPVMSGLEAISAIRCEFPTARIAVLSTFAGDARASRALQAGAMAYLLKARVRTDLLLTLKAVASGHKYIDPDVAMQLAEHSSDEPLTGRELQVLEWVCRGRSNKRIAEVLDISEGTVKSHLKGILLKLRATDRTHAMMISLERGITSLDMFASDKAMI